MTKKHKTHKYTIFILIITLLALIIMPFFGYKFYNHAMYPLKYQATIEKYAKQYDISLSLCYSLVKAESNFDEKAVSHAGAKGLAQITDKTFAWLISSNKEFSDIDKNDIFDPNKNIQVGFFYLKKNLDKYEDETLALCAYNAGPGKVDQWLIDSRYSTDDKQLEVIPISETDKYVQKILKARERYKTIYKMD